MRLPCKQTYTADNNAQTRLTLKSTKADVAAYGVVSTGYVPFATSFSFIPDSVQISGTAYIVFWMSISPCEIKAGADLQGTTLKHQILVSVRNQKNIDTE